jgi:adenylate kinase
MSANSREIGEAILSIEDQVVTRDFSMIDQSDYVVVFYPKKDLAAGVICEMMHAYAQRKRVIALHPFRPSPFFRLLCDDRKIFTDEEEFQRFLIEQSGIA